MREGLNVYAIGDFGTRDRWNPDFLISSLGAWPWLRALVREPLTPAALAEKVQLPVTTVETTVSSLSELGVLSRSGNKVKLGFAWFTAADQAAIHASVIGTAQVLADRIRARQAEIDQHLRHVKAIKWVDLPDLRFAVVGCFGLDWGGLEALKASGHLEHNKAQPGGRHYIMYVEESVADYQQRDYTGSHTLWINEAHKWTSFGDHSGRRFGLPDLVWHLRGAVTRSEHLPAESRSELGDLVMDAVSGQLDTAADVLIRAVNGDRTSHITHPLLEVTHAIGAEGPAIPVFFWCEDGEPIGQVVEIVKETLLSTVTERFAALQADLAGLTALRHGVPFAETFNPIWHTLFGHTNRILAEDGFLADPAPRTDGEGRYRWWLTVGE